jgi:hypothetical protein
VTGGSSGWVKAVADLRARDQRLAQVLPTSSAAVAAEARQYTFALYTCAVYLRTTHLRSMLAHAADPPPCPAHLMTRRSVREPTYCSTINMLSRTSASVV